MCIWNEHCSVRQTCHCDVNPFIGRKSALGTMTAVRVEWSESSVCWEQRRFLYERFMTLYHCGSRSEEEHNSSWTVSTALFYYILKQDHSKSAILTHFESYLWIDWLFWLINVWDWCLGQKAEETPQSQWSKIQEINQCGI